MVNNKTYTCLNVHVIPRLNAAMKIVVDKVDKLIKESTFDFFL